MILSDAAAAADGPVEARLRFRSGAGGGGEYGDLVLFADGTVQVFPSAALRVRLEAAARGAEQGLLAWGSSLLMALAAGGAVLYLRGRPGGSAVFFLASGATGVLGGLARKQALGAPVALTARHPAHRVTLMTDEPGSFGWKIAGGPFPPCTMGLRAGEFDEAEAEAFAVAFRRVAVEDRSRR